MEHQLKERHILHTVQPLSSQLGIKMSSGECVEGRGGGGREGGVALRCTSISSRGSRNTP